jgi:hypothetical protein
VNDIAGSSCGPSDSGRIHVVQSGAHSGFGPTLLACAAPYPFIELEPYVPTIVPVDVGTSHTVDVTLTSYGDPTTPITNVRLLNIDTSPYSGTAWAMTGNTCTSLAFGETCTISVTFTAPPSPFTEYLRVSYDLPADAHGWLGVLLIGSSVN